MRRNRKREGDGDESRFSPLSQMETDWTDHDQRNLKDKSNHKRNLTLLWSLSTVSLYKEIILSSNQLGLKISYLKYYILVSGIWAVYGVWCRFVHGCLKQGGVPSITILPPKLLVTALSRDQLLCAKLATLSDVRGLDCFGSVVLGLVQWSYFKKTCLICCLVTKE